jgi:hypothetical protein
MTLSGQRFVNNDDDDDDVMMSWLKALDQYFFTKCFNALVSAGIKYLNLGRDYV